MGIGYPPHNKQDRLLRGAGNVLQVREENALLQGVESPHRGDEFFDVLAPALEEAAKLQEDESPHHETNDFLLLLEENARLRKLAVTLSNLLGDLPSTATATTDEAAQCTLERSDQPRPRQASPRKA